MRALPPQHGHAGKISVICLRPAQFCDALVHLTCPRTLQAALVHPGYGHSASLQCWPLVPLASLASNAFRYFSLTHSKDQRDQKMPGRSRRYFQASRKKNHLGRSILFPKPSCCLFSPRSLDFLITHKVAAQPLLPPHPAHPVSLLLYPFIKQQSQKTGSLQWHHSRQ